MQTRSDPRGGLRGLSDRYPRLVLLPFSIALGVLMALGFALNDEPGMATGAVLVMTLFGSYIAFSKSEYAVAGTPEGDERQRLISLEAAQVAYFAMTVVAVVGFLWEDVYNHVSGEPPGIFTLMSVVSAVSYGVAFFFLRRRR